MQDDIFPAAEKILSDIENVVKKNPSLKGFEIIPAEDNENKSPVFHQEEYLGLASWCVQPLYCYAYRRLLELRQNRLKREESSTVARWLLGALLLNPDVSTFWNIRRELVRCRKLDPSSEMSFSRLVLYHKPKCFEAFAYRRWLLPYILDTKEKNYDPVPAESPLSAEIEIAGTCANRYANNYHAWSHRRHIMTLRESRGYSHPTFESEWTNSLAWCQQHVSDHSGLAYRQFLLTKCILASVMDSRETLIESTDSTEHSRHSDTVLSYVMSGTNYSQEDRKMYDSLRREAVNDLEFVHGKTHRTLTEDEQRACIRALSYWVEECRINEEAINRYTDHEALWCHRRFLAHLLARLAISYKKYSCYKVELLELPLTASPDNIEREEKAQSTSTHNTQISKCSIEMAFRARNKSIVEFAKKRSEYEKTLAESFVQFLNNIGIEV